MVSVCIPTTTGESTQRNNLPKWLQHAQLQSWSHHILKCRLNSLVIHRLNHMNKRSKEKNADWERGWENKQTLAFWFPEKETQNDLNTFFFLRRKNVVRRENVLTVLKMGCGSWERGWESPQHNLVFMTAKANHTVKYQIYTDLKATMCLNSTFCSTTRTTLWVSEQKQFLTRNYKRHWTVFNAFFPCY